MRHDRSAEPSMPAPTGTTWLLERAREIDPPAWAAPLLSHLGRRRDLSVAMAFRELLASRRTAIWLR
jgi:hypothetical protein